MKVQYIGCSDVQVHWGSNVDPRETLVIGAIYDVCKTEIHRWHTKYFLVGFKGAFPASCFKPVWEAADEGH